ncbi:MAG: DUF4956 domain-containing protein [Flavobacteriales bacterium]
MSELFNIPLFDDDFYKMVFRFFLNIFFLTLIIRWLYYSNSNRKDYTFAFYMVGIIVFFLCFTLKKFQLDLGMALGLFAIFGIIRYRTTSIDIKEMTYLFVVIGVSVINSLANRKLSYAEIVGANTIIIACIYIIENVWQVHKLSSKKIVYDKIENIKPENYEILKKDIEDRMGFEVSSVKVGSVDFIKGTASVNVKYYQSK